MASHTITPHCLGWFHRKPSPSSMELVSETQDAPPKTPGSQFLRLPVELRHQILLYLLPEGQTITFLSHSDPINIQSTLFSEGIFYVSRSVRRECMFLLLTSNIFSMGGIHVAGCFLTMIGEEGRQILKHVHLGIMVPLKHREAFYIQQARDAGLLSRLVRKTIISARTKQWRQWLVATKPAGPRLFTLEQTAKLLASCTGLRQVTLYLHRQELWYLAEQQRQLSGAECLQLWHIPGIKTIRDVLDAVRVKEEHVTGQRVRVRWIGRFTSYGNMDYAILSKFVLEGTTWLQPDEVVYRENSYLLRCV